MRHYSIKGGYNRHYAVGHNGMGGVLIQLGEDISIEPGHCQVRVCLTPEEADHMIGLLQQAKKKAVEYEGEAKPRTPEAADVSV